jgi:hypothetical protein
MPIRAGHVGHELIAAAMLILAGGGRGVPLDYVDLERWTRIGYERRTRARHRERCGCRSMTILSTQHLG